LAAGLKLAQERAGAAPVVVLLDVGLALMWFLKALFVLTLGLAGPLHAEPAVAVRNFLVIGVIASNKQSSGIALLKDVSNGKTFATKEGQAIEPAMTLSKVGRKTVEVIIDSQLYVIEVGADTASGIERGPIVPVREGYTQSVVAEVRSAIEVDGNTVKVTQDFKDQLVKADLNKILMQAAAVPHLVDGRLSGFQLWEIERDSVFDVAGFKDGDIVTAINDQPISDISRTLRHLSSLKNAHQAKFDYLRNGAHQNITVLVQ